jgi:hypothetical protein
MNLEIAAGGETDIKPLVPTKLTQLNGVRDAQESTKSTMKNKNIYYKMK